MTENKFMLQLLAALSIAAVLTGMLAIKLIIERLPKISYQTVDFWGFGSFDISLSALCIMACTFSIAFFFLIMIKSLLML